MPGAAAKARGKEAGKLIGDMDARRIVFVDGTFVPELSDLTDLSPGMSIRSTKFRLRRRHNGGSTRSLN